MYAGLKREILRSQKLLLAIHNEIVRIRGSPDDEAGRLCLSKLHAQLERAKRGRAIAVERYEQVSGKVYVPAKDWLVYRRYNLRAGAVDGV